MTHPATGRRIPELILELAQPVALGEETMRLLPPASWGRDGEPLRAGQFLSIGWELRIILEVGERWVRVAPLDGNHSVTHDIERMEQFEQEIGWYRLTPAYERWLVPSDIETMQ